MELSTEAIEQVNDAIARAEQSTSGEIFCVVARKSGAYGEVPLAYGAGVAMLLPLLLASLGLPPWELVGIDSESLSRETTLLAYALSQFLVFIATAAVVSIRPLRMALAPEPLKRARVDKRALEIFLSKGLHLTQRRTGVLLYASLAERHATIIADEPVRKHLETNRWLEATEALDAAVRRRHPTEGLIKAVQFCGSALAQNFPADPANPNELPDEVVMI